MTVMAECKENIVFRANGEGDEAAAAVAKDDFALVKAYENAVKPFKPADVKDSAASTETDSREEQGDGQADRQADREGDGQRAADGETPCPAAAETSAPSKWAIGARCQAVWSEDGRLYACSVVWTDGRRCRVRFDGYGNEEEMELSALKSPEAAEPQRDRRVWKVGSRCRAVYSEDGLVYPAVLVWVRGERCTVRFDSYNNEEELDLIDLLAPDELNGPSRAASARAGGRKPSLTGSSDWKRREESQGEKRGGGERERERRPAWREEPPAAAAASVKERPSYLNKAEKDPGDNRRGNFQRDGAEKPASSLFSLFPPVPPPPPTPGSAEFVSFVPPPPPPPPLWASGGRSDVDTATLSAMLMSWYMCGFHTGSYMAQQQTRTNSRPPSCKD
ncbi:uncharacterized protein LOC139908153 [Centroberyx gerrardi]